MMEPWHEWEAIIEDLDAGPHEVTAKEAAFLESLLAQRPARLSPRQVQWLEDMQWKYLVF